MVFKMKGMVFKQQTNDRVEVKMDDAKRKTELDKKAIMDRMKALELIIKKNKKLNMPYDQELKELSELEDKLMNVKKLKG